MLAPLDEYPIHQLPQPMADVGSSDRNFYDRCYFNAHDRTGDLFVITGARLLPQPRHQGRVRPGPPRRRADRRAPQRRAWTTTG